MAILAVTSPLTVQALSGTVLGCFSGNGTVFLHDYGRIHVCTCNKHAGGDDVTVFSKLQVQVKATKNGKIVGKIENKDGTNKCYYKNNDDYMIKCNSSKSDSHVAYARAIVKDFTCIPCYEQGKQDLESYTTEWLIEQ